MPNAVKDKAAKPYEARNNGAALKPIAATPPMTAMFPP